MSDIYLSRQFQAEPCLQAVVAVFVFLVHFLLIRHELVNIALMFWLVLLYERQKYVKKVDLILLVQVLT